MTPRGSLTVVGTGIALGIHLTDEARAAITIADRFFYLAVDPLAEKWLSGLHAASSNLRTEYNAGEDRIQIYERIVERILEPVRAAERVTAAFYGHPGVYVTPSHVAIRRARAEGHEARMLPAISAEDCLYADLGVDPASSGCASYDATDFLLRHRPVDTSSSLILWQICVIGDARAVTEPRLENLPVLVDRLLEHYPRDHRVVVYEASPYPIAPSLMEWVALTDLASVEITPMSTLYVPPATVRPTDPELSLRLGFSTQPTPTA